MKDREEVLAIVRQLNIIDGTLFQKMAEDIDFCEEMISTIMEQKIKVKKVVPQSSEVAELMRIFKEPDAYDFKKFPKVSKRKKQFKESEGGDETMCDLVENYANKKAVQEAKDNALRFFQNGANYELVRASIVLLSDEELQEIYKKAKKG